MAKSPSDRPSQVQTQDLTESRINEDFVFWLKKNGSNYLLVILLAACAALGYNYWQRKEVEKSTVAWEELGQATIPESLDEVAKAHANVPQVAMIAELSAGDRRLAQIRSGELTPKQGDTPAVLLDEATRKITQDAADANYTKAAEIAVKLANGSREQAITVVLPTLFGRAAVAESRGDFEGSRKLLEEAAALAGNRWPGYEKLAKWRANETLTLATAVPLPTAAELPVKATTPVAPASGGDDLFQQLIQEQAAQEQSAPPPAPANGSTEQPSSSSPETPGAGG